MKYEVSRVIPHTSYFIPPTSYLTKPTIMKKSMRNRLHNEINAGSMADIAFLLLIFFLVTTTIDVDKGIFVKLPYWEEIDTPIDIPSRNVFSIKVNKNDQLLVEGEVGQMSSLKEQVKEFIMNPLQKAHLAAAPNKAVVALQNDRSTTYTTYLAVYNEVKAAYTELWEAEAKRRYDRSYVDLPIAAKKEIRNKIPSVISESEPTVF